MFDLLRKIEKIKTLKSRIAERIDFYDRNRDKISKEDIKKIEFVKGLILKDLEGADLGEMERSLIEISEIKMVEKKIEFKNLKRAYKNYFEGKFMEAEKILKNIPEEEKENPHYNFLISLINLTNYYLNENKDQVLWNNAKSSFIKAKEKGFKLEDLNKIPISPKILEIYNSFIQ